MDPVQQARAESRIVEVDRRAVVQGAVVGGDTAAGAGVVLEADLQEDAVQEADNRLEVDVGTGLEARADHNSVVFDHTREAAAGHRAWAGVDHMSSLLVEEVGFAASYPLSA
jgi:hypothetical protein